VYPGNRMGAIWSDSPNPSATWATDVEFRVGGPEHGGGNLQIWYTKENQNQLGANNVHTVHSFQGLVIVVDQHGGAGGMIRAFLNDGSVDYANHHHVESLAFGHCYYAYRNLGRASKLRLLQDHAGFEVTIDDRHCFRSNEVGHNLTSLNTLTDRLRSYCQRIITWV
jgi:mannose-binding lectin 1